MQGCPAPHETLSLMQVPRYPSSGDDDDAVAASPMSAVDDSIATSHKERNSAPTTSGQPSGRRGARSQLRHPAAGPKKRSRPTQPQEPWMKRSHKWSHTIRPQEPWMKRS